MIVLLLVISRSRCRRYSSSTRRIVPIFITPKMVTATVPDGYDGFGGLEAKGVQEE